LTGTWIIRMMPQCSGMLKYNILVHNHSHKSPPLGPMLHHFNPVFIFVWGLIFRVYHSNNCYFHAYTHIHIHMQYYIAYENELWWWKKSVLRFARFTRSQTPWIWNSGFWKAVCLSLCMCLASTWIVEQILFMFDI
jgi:hypothetical protein